MRPLTRNDLLSLEEYSARREGIRREVMAHKAARVVAVGPNLRLFFEDRVTVRYQVQEMLRVERIFEVEGIQAELDAYNPLVPDGANWKATLLIEFPDVDDRRRQLARLIGIEDRTWVEVEGDQRVYAIADEDLERDTADKTSAVHFLRFELSPTMIRELRAGAALSMGVDHEHYRHLVAPVSEATRVALLGDLGQTLPLNAAVKPPRALP